MGEVATVAKVSTLRRWHQWLKNGKLFAQQIRYRSGRRRTPAEVEALVVTMAQENPHWGQKRISGELHGLGIRTCPRTIFAILKRHALSPKPRSGPRWQPFIADHAQQLVAIDFLTWDVAIWLGKKTVYVLFAIHLGTRRAEILRVTDAPDNAFMQQVARNMTMAETGFLPRVGTQYLIEDRDTKFSRDWKGILKASGVEVIAIPPKSPNLNALAERWVRTVKTECMRNVLILGINGLRRLLTDYVEHYNAERPHQGLGNKPPIPIAGAQQLVPGQTAGKIACRTRCGGVISHYHRLAA